MRPIDHHSLKALRGELFSPSFFYLKAEVQVGLLHNSNVPVDGQPIYSARILPEDAQLSRIMSI